MLPPERVAKGEVAAVPQQGLVRPNGVLGADVIQCAFRPEEMETPPVRSRLVLMFMASPKSVHSPPLD